MYSENNSRAATAHAHRPQMRTGEYSPLKNPARHRNVVVPRAPTPVRTRHHPNQQSNIFNDVVPSARPSRKPPPNTFRQDNNIFGHAQGVHRKPLRRTKSMGAGLGRHGGIKRYGPSFSSQVFSGDTNEGVAWRQNIKNRPQDADMFGGPVTQKPNTTTSATFQSSVFSEKGGQKAPQGRRNTNKRYSDVLLRNYEAPKKHGFSRRQGEYSYKFSQFTHLQKEPPSTFKANKNQQRKPDHDILFRSEKRNADEMQAPRGLKSLPGPKGQPTILIPKEDYFFDTKPGKRALQPTGVHQNDILLQTYMPDLSPQRGRKHAGKPKDNIDMHFNEGQPRKTLSKSQSAKVIQVNYEQTYAKQAHTNRQAFLEYAKKELKNSEQKDYTSIKFANEDGRNVVDTMSHTAHLKKNRPVSVSEQKYQARKSYAALAKKKKSKKKRSKPVKLTEKVKIHNRRIALNHVNSNNSINVAKIKQRGRDGENRIQARQVSSHGHLF